MFSLTWAYWAKTKIIFVFSSQILNEDEANDYYGMENFI